MYFYHNKAITKKKSESCAIIYFGESAAMKCKSWRIGKRVLRKQLYRAKAFRVLSLKSRKIVSPIEGKNK